MIDKELYRELMELMGFMITSARGLLDEPQMYGPFRLIDGASKLCAIMENRVEVDNELLARIKDKIDEGKFNVMTDLSSFTSMLDEVVLDSSEVPAIFDAVHFVDATVVPMLFGAVLFAVSLLTTTALPVGSS